ncbi:Uncharacterized protein HZ326_29439 [Fusarium oxysporum f. sp. albedinis]|nr:Uncharacterized protein HZ326_29439 [Fusarium oxysporum f. sp. albedinis]
MRGTTGNSRRVAGQWLRSVRHLAVGRGRVRRNLSPARIVTWPVIHNAALIHDCCNIERHESAGWFSRLRAPAFHKGQLSTTFLCFHDIPSASMINDHVSHFKKRPLRSLAST